MSLKLYNSLTNKIEEFKTEVPNEVKMYVCGPTVYNYIHIGNARPVVFYDMVKRYLEFCGYKVTYASNITDIDDKIINKALEEGKSEVEIATFYENAYFRDVNRLGSLRPDVIPHATAFMAEMINFIKDLINNGYAYESNGNVYFRISKVDDYGCLSNQALDELSEGARVDVDMNKENPLDFTLWKNTSVGIKWDSPFGAGRPGWHTECVVMNHTLFGRNLDIHGGGMDLKFPHHENEIAQSEAMYNNHLANYWLHVGRVDLSGTKMSKSLGNVIYVKDLASDLDCMIMRMLLLFSPYRSIINYTEELFNQYKASYEKWARAYKSAYYFLLAHDYKLSQVSETAIETFKKYMDDDFNVQNVMTLIEELIKKINQDYRSKNYDELAVNVATFTKIIEVLGLNFYLIDLEPQLKETYLAWEEARANKDFAKADVCRNTLSAAGII